MSDSEEDFLEAIRIHQEAKAENEPPRSRQLLEDCLKIFALLNEPERLKTASLISGLNESLGDEYAGLRYGKGINDRLLAKWLRPYGITPKQIRFGEEGGKGYYKVEFEEVFNRYSGSDSSTLLSGETTETTETEVGLW
jgi:hypothetical protein